MSAERNPPRQSLLARPLAALTASTLRRPRLVLLTAAVLAVAASIYGSASLKFKTNRLALLNPQSHYNQRWLAYLDEFGDQDDAVVVVEGPDTRLITTAMDDLARQIAARGDRFEHVFCRNDMSQLRRKGLQLLDQDQLLEVRDFVQRMEPVCRGQVQQLQLHQLLLAMAQQIQQAPDDRSLGTACRAMIELVESLSLSLQSPRQYRSPFGRGGQLDPNSSRSEYLLSEDERFGFVLVRLRGDESQMDRHSQAVDELRDLIGGVASRHGRVRIGLTGMPVLENDEMRTSQADMMRASVLSLVGVALLFMLAFGSWRHPLLTVATLMLALGWTCGYITLAVGHLNILSVSFGVILIGLGIDYGIHFVANYRQQQQSDVAAALRETAGHVGPAIVSGGLTTALAFFTARWTAFTGVAELGTISAGGILLCVLAALVVLPPLIYLADRGRPGPRPMMRWALAPPAILRWPVVRFPRTVLAMSALLTVALAGSAWNVRYDHNLLNLQAAKLQSVTLERRLQSNTRQSVWFAVSMSSDRRELLRRKAAFERLDQVERVEQIATLLPPPDPRRQQWIADLRSRLEHLPERPPALAVPDIDQLALAVRQLQQSLLHRDRQQPAHPEMPAWLAAVDALQQRLSHVPAAVARSLLAVFQQRMAADLLVRLHRIRDSTDPLPIHMGDLPAGLITRFIGTTGQQQLRVFARADADIWDMQNLERFVRQVESVDPRVTGHPVQTYYASRQMQTSYVHAAIYAAFAVAIVLMLDLRHIRHTLLALVPVVLGLLQLLGLLAWLDIPLNAANMIVLPLILGIGIDDGVHVIHDLRRQQGRYVPSLSTGMAVVLTSLTTMIGFGSLMLADHQGVRSLGQVLTIGVFCCMLTSLFTLPAWLCLVTRRAAAQTAYSGSPSADEPLPTEPREGGWRAAG